MAIALDTASGSGYHAADGSYSFNLTVGSNNNRILVASVGLLSVVNSVTALTYNNIGLTKLRSDVSASTTVRTEIWYLVAPDTGTHAIAITLNSANVSGITVTSYYNVDQSSPIDAQNGGTGITGAGGGSSSISTTTVTPNNWTVDAVATADTTIAATAGQTERGNISGAVGTAGQSDKGPNSTGSIAMGWDNIGALTTWTMSTVALAQAAGISPSSSVSPSASISPSLSPSSSISLSLSPSSSASRSLSPSASISRSLSPSSSISASLSPSASVSLSLSPSASVSRSLSPSSSVSPSPSLQIEGRIDLITATKKTNPITATNKTGSDITAVQIIDSLDITQSSIADIKAIEKIDSVSSQV